jgi:hypothetical protein
VRQLQYGEGRRLLDLVRVGWTTARLRALAGDPHHCEADLWIYDAGPRTGPQAVYDFRIDHGQVVGVHVSVIACSIVL